MFLCTCVICVCVYVKLNNVINVFRNQHAKKMCEALQLQHHVLWSSASDDSSWAPSHFQQPRRALWYCLDWRQCGPYGRVGRWRKTLKFLFPAVYRPRFLGSSTPYHSCYLWAEFCCASIWKFWRTAALWGVVLSFRLLNVPSVHTPVKATWLIHISLSWAAVSPPPL